VFLQLFRNSVIDLPIPV